MKKLFLSCLLSALCLTTAFSANYSGTCGDNLTWDLTDGVLTIGGTGAMYDYDILKSTSRAPWYAIRSSIQEISIGDSVTSIGSGAFYKCTSLASITIPNCVTSIGNYAFRDCTGLTSVTIGNSVTNIRNGVFQNCTNLTSITIPNSVTSIEGSAFNGCSGLTSPVCNEYIFAFLPRSYSGAYVIPNGIEIVASDAFYNCSGLTSVTIPNSVTSIGNSAFSGCSSLTSVTIPNSVTSIGNSAFSGCSSLTSPIYNTHIFVFMPTSYSGEYIISDGINSIAGNAFRGCSGLTSVTIPNSVTSIEYNAFYGCSGLTSVTIPNSVTSIGEWAFSHCSSLTSVTIPNSVTSIEGSAFNGCSGLTSVTIPNSVTSIGVSAFSGCSSLTSVTIPNSVTSIEGSAFNGCSGLRKIIFGESLTSLGSNLLKGCSKLDTIVWNAKNFKISSSTDNPFYDGDNYSTNWDVRSQIKSFILGPNVDTIPAYLCCGMTGISSIIIPNSVTSIGYEAFRDCTGLTSVTIGNSVTSIGDRAFWGCSGLTSVTIGNSVTSIGDDAFYKCTGLTSVTIPNSVTSIGNYAFQSCSGLTSITIPNSVTSIGYRAFYNCSGLTAIYVPCGEMERFKQMLNNDSRINDHAPLPYTITINAEHGNVTYPQTMCVDMSLNATPDYGYHFTQWSDGNKENPRTIVLTQDTTFTAEFAIDRSGTCGDDNALTWTYDVETKTLTITGKGTLNSNYTFGVEAPTQMQKLVIGNEVTSIGDSAFYGMSTINHLIIGGSVATIGNYAFAECRNFDDITCYATTVPVINATTFANVGNKQYIYLFVPEEKERAYHRDTYWGEFDIQVQHAEETTVTTNDVQVEPQDNAVTVTWPTSENAASYTIQITKDGVVFCTLIFNGNGQLTGIAFAPSRDGQAHAPAATMTANGMQFTVTGLNSNTQYGYNLTAKDANDQTVATYSGEFTTTGEIATGIDNIQGNEVQSTKVLRDGQIFILRGDKTYTLQGQEVK